MPSSLTLEGRAPALRRHRSLEFNEEAPLGAARLENELITDGERMPVRDPMIAATARSTGDHLVVAESDFQTDTLDFELQVTNLRGE
jgi:predicted nucleic acid-binding protein